MNLIIKKKNIIIGSVAGGLFLTVIFAIFLFNRFQVTNKQKQIIETKNKEITDSINYAQRIQQAILPQRQIFQNSFSEYFIFYRPKDIVSGDFYWISKKENKNSASARVAMPTSVPNAGSNSSHTQR